MFIRKIKTPSVFALAVFFSVSAVANGLIAPTPLPSGLTVQVEPIGNMPLDTEGNNIASPQPYGPTELFLISHTPTKVYSLITKGKNEGELTLIYDDSQTPAEINPTGNFALMNVAGDHAKKLFIIYGHSHADVWFVGWLRYRAAA